MIAPGNVAVSITFEVEAETTAEAIRIILSVLDNRGLNEDSAVVDYWVTKKTD